MASVTVPVKSPSSEDPVHVFCGLPLLHFPCGFHQRACCTVLVEGFLTVWPSQPCFLLVMWILRVLSCTSAYPVVHLMWSMCQRHIEGFWPEWCISTVYHAWDTPFWPGTLEMFTKICVLCAEDLVACQIYVMEDSHVRDSEIGALLDTLWDACQYRVSVRTGFPGVGILLMGEVVSLICNLYLRVWSTWNEISFKLHMTRVTSVTTGPWVWCQLQGKHIDATVRNAMVKFWLFEHLLYVIVLLVLYSCQGCDWNSFDIYIIHMWGS